MDSMAASGFGWSNAIALMLTIGAYYVGVYIQHQVAGSSAGWPGSMPLRTRLLIGLIPCAVVVSGMGPIVSCTLADWTLLLSLALICEQGFLVEHFFTRLTTRSA